MIGATRGLSLSVLTYNLHLFGDTALYRHGGVLQETGFYYKDHERLPQIIAGLRRTEADVIGLTEVWDEGMRGEIEGSLKDLYPYHVASPAAAGIGRVINDFQDKWPLLAQILFGAGGGVVNHFTKGHYSVGKTGLLTGLMNYLSEEQVPRAIARWLRSGPVWGAGLLFLSRYPIVASDFHPHDERADWEVLAGKGVLEATVRPDTGPEMTFSLGHYQEGISPRAMQTRGRQIHRARNRTRKVPASLFHIGDFNVAGATREYAAMSRTMSLRDVNAGDTYLEPNPYQDKLQAPRSQDARTQRIDYIFHSGDLVMESARILRGEFRSRDAEHDLSDHFPLLARFFHRPEVTAI
ncbi:MAG TPA: endonuclease/exonuclease/phosphatase family protein [bacterium]|nr:endonuclease/exonuclease/phosphatase family protein [bacterium]